MFLPPVKNVASRQREYRFIFHIRVPETDDFQKSKIEYPSVLS